MKILHTESSPGWGGQELRILKEAEGMRKRGHEIILAIQKGGGLVRPAREAGFTVYEIAFNKPLIPWICLRLGYILFKHRIDLVNTHSSLDGWLGGFMARLTGRPIIRTRHLSTPIRPGLNSKLLYRVLADIVVTTCKETAETIQKKTNPQTFSIPTGVDPNEMQVDEEKVNRFRLSYGVQADEILAGTLCVIRGWKGITDLLHAAKRLENIPKLKWMVVGGGVSADHFYKERDELGLQERVIFTGYIHPPSTALAAMDLFLLLSWANEGVSQASLQAAWLKKPLITTPTGGLKEICLEGKSGMLVSVSAPEEVAKAVKSLFHDREKRRKMGEEAYQLVANHFTLQHTLDSMEALYKRL